MAKRNSTGAKTARKIREALSQIRAMSVKLGADCASTLLGSDLSTANHALLPLFELSDSLVLRESVELDEALAYPCDAELCELLLNLLRRCPWAEMRREHAVMQEGLELLPKVLNSLHVFLHAAAHVCSNQQASAYAEMSKRCLSQMHALGCAEKLHNQTS